MSEIASRLGAGFTPSVRHDAATHAGADGTMPARLHTLPSPAVGQGPLRVTLDDIAHPAYMINHNFELVWINGQGRERVFAGLGDLPATSDGRNLFRLLPQAAGRDWSSLLRFHIGLAKSRLSPERFSLACQGLDHATFGRLQQIYADTAAEPAQPVLSAPVSLPGEGADQAECTAFAAYFREGIFIVLVPAEAAADPMLELLARRDEVIRGLLRRRLPVLTHLAVLVADLQSSVKICSELPPEEYFELINEIWTTLALVFRRHHGTCGKHVGDGLVYYFFPQPDSDYLANAIACAQEIRTEIQKLSKSWQIRKNWLNDLFLNTGITEGQEWLGTYQSSTGVEFVVLGDTINQAARISDFARHGGIWATKSLVGKLPADTRDRLRFGVRRRSPDGRELFVASSFSLVSSLLEQDGARMEKLRDIATLPVTEIVELALPPG